jgi:hypothetical protein
MEFPRSDDPEQRGHIQRDVVILVVIVGLLCLCFAALGVGGYYFYDQQSALQAQGATATSAYMATKIKQDTDAEATRQAEASATTQALAVQATATMVAKDTELRAYQYFDPFESNSDQWRTGEEDNDYWIGQIDVTDGIYVWRVEEVKETFLAWTDFTTAGVLKDFDLAVLTKRAAGGPLDACSGVMFRKSPDGFDSGAYLLSFCDQGDYSINYYSEETSWEKIRDWQKTDLARPNDWNLIEVKARGENFEIFLNHQFLTSFQDDRLAEGYVSLFIDQYEQTASEIWFDNFALQPRE